MSLPARPSDRSAFEIAIICALVPEANAIQAIFDHIWDDEDDEAYIGRAAGDLNQYTVGKIGKHYVVLAYLPDMGSTSAATLSSTLAMSFPNIRLAIVAGVCGGVPRPPHYEKDIFLGDLVVSTAIIQYDFGRQHPKGFEKKHEVLDNPGRPLRELRGFVKKMETNRDYQKTQKEIINTIADIQKRSEEMAHPGNEGDILFAADFQHKHHTSDPPDCACGQQDDEICQEAREATCTTLQCKGPVVLDRKRPRTAHLDVTSETHVPAIHVGYFGSANTVMKSGRHRDDTSKTHKVIALEMESVGVWEVFPCCLVVKSVSDYADSHKNKTWQPYSALVAAAGVKALLQKWKPVRSEQAGARKSLNKYWMVRQPPSARFTGRRTEMTKIETIINDHLDRNDLSNPCRVVVTGIGGMGKSELCLQVTKKLGQRFWGVFWIDVDNEVQAKAGLVKICQRLGHEVDSVDDAIEQINGLQEIFLLVLDNADDTKLDYYRPLPSSSFATVLMTSRNSRCSKFATAQHHVPLERLNHPDDEKLLHDTISNGNANAGPLDPREIIEVCDMLSGHTLAIVQAGAYISQGCSLKQYKQEFQRHRKYLMEFHEEQAQSRYGDVYSTFEVAAQRLSDSSAITDRDALELLHILAMFDWTALPLSMFHAARRCKGLFEGGRRQRTWKILTSWHVEHLPDWVVDPTTPALIWHRDGSLDGSSSTTPDPALNAPRDSSTQIETSHNTRLHRAIDALQKLALVTLVHDQTDTMVTMHPLVHAWAKDRQTALVRGRSWTTGGCILSSLQLDSNYLRAAGLALKTHLVSFTAGTPPLSSSAEVLPIAVMCIEYMLLMDLHFEVMVSSQGLISKLPLAVCQSETVHWGLKRLHAIACSYSGHDEMAVATLLPLIERVRDTPVITSEQQADVIISCSQSLRLLDRSMEARSLVEPLLQDLTESNPDSGIVMFVRREMATILSDMGQHDEAISLLLSVVELEAELGEAHDTFILDVRGSLAAAYTFARRYFEALVQRRIIFEIRSRVEPETSYWRIQAGIQLAKTYILSEQPLLALGILDGIRDAIKISGRSWIRLHLEHAYVTACAYVDLDRKTNVLLEIEDVFNLYRGRLKPSDYLIVRVQNLMSKLFWESNRRDEAVEMLSQVVANQRQGHHGLDNAWCRQNEERLARWKKELSIPEGSGNTAVDILNSHDLGVMEQNHSMSQSKSTGLNSTSTRSSQDSRLEPPSKHDEQRPRKRLRLASHVTG
ncbi:hypothetical protein KVT40_002467 [Elsinoe batatas]|uniref:Nucleoside phosphorylase domain-containing protein n=1 Tax=Elsinoe batatas TaxID=2601811 RepID=A0A8K0LEQ9_9PEZI|nr:hypothetical protein KVT40_002467 [Elsinoe batatas]